MQFLVYQELYLFYSFFKSIMPRVTLSDLYDHKPGATVAGFHVLQRDWEVFMIWGWIYVHMDEVLEMLIVRLIKALNVPVLPYLENSRVMLLSVCAGRMIIRTMTGASHSC